MGIYPAVDPLASTSRALSPEIVGEEHYEVARQVQHTLQRYRELQDIIAILGMDELGEEDKLVVRPCSSYSILLISKLPRCRTIYWSKRFICSS